MIIKYLIEVILLSEFLAAIVGGIFTLAGTFIALWFQFRKDDKDKRKDYHNDQVSSLDVTASKLLTLVKKIQWKFIKILKQILNLLIPMFKI